MRLHVYLAKAGVASRRASEKLIRAGRVSVNGVVVTALGTTVGENDRVVCDGRLVTPLRRRIHLAMHKPVGFLCTQHDERGRPVVIDLIPEALRPGLFHVGRLDLMSEGLIFYTNDGDFAEAVMHPSGGVEKEYLLEAVSPIPERMLVHYRNGMTIDGMTYRAVSYARETKTRVRLVLGEGKNREIRRVCAFFGVVLRRLIRLRIGPVKLGTLPTGCFRHLKKAEIQWFLEKHGGEAPP